MEDGSMAHGDVITENERNTLRHPLIFMRHMKHRTVLYVSAYTDPDAVDITPDDRHRPYRNVISKHHGTRDAGHSIEVNTGPQLGAFKHEPVYVLIFRRFHEERMVTPLTDGKEYSCLHFLCTEAGEILKSSTY
jgi:hypothetical protein